jgi:GTP cyclohydrolase I
MTVHKPRPVEIMKRAKPSRCDAEAAVRTLLAWAGDDPSREGLLDTPKRVAKAFDEWFGGYTQDASQILNRVFTDVGGYDDMVLLRAIDVKSHCEHHMAPFIGTAHIAYLPKDGVVGISKIARLVDMYAKRLQTQENLTAQIVSSLETHLKPRGTAIIIEAVHQCMTTRGVGHAGVSTVTTKFTGEFNADPALQDKFLALAR